MPGSEVHLLVARLDKQVTSTGYTKSAALAWLLYDYVLTIDQEVDFVWRRRWGLVTFLYFLARYLPLAILATSSATNFLPNVSHLSCDRFQWVEAIATFIIFVVVQVILQFRLYVMHGKSRRVLYTNICLCVLELIGAGVLVGIFFPLTQPLDNSDLVFGSCFSKSPREIAVVLVAPLVYETYLAILAMRKTFQDRTRAVGKKTSLMTLLIRDNIVYFVLIAVTLIVVTVAWFLEPVVPGNSLISFAHVSGSIGGTRLIVNVRHAALTMDEKDNGDVTDESPEDYELPVMRPASGITLNHKPIDFDHSTSRLSPIVSLSDKSDCSDDDPTLVAPHGLSRSQVHVAASLC